MARMQGITGKLSGKMGSAVFRVREGQQVVTQYNPIVKNPNSDGQKSQRAKFKLMSQLAAIMAPAMGSFIIKVRKEGGKQTQRNAFVQKNFNLVEVSSDDQQVTAKIPMEEVQLTGSFKHLPQIELTPATNSVDVDFAQNLPTGVSSVRLITIGYVGDVASIVDMRDIPATTIEQNPVNIELPEGKYTILAYGLIPSESVKASVDLDNIHTPADEAFISAVELNAMVAEGSMSETKTVGANVTIGS